ncbi:MAG: NAD(P)/FAD-dependent oxidoreductase [Nitrospirota bacterium]|nr:NAD(P)/FAD-dependent oxidoreductase [Nitrospirota bacterium]
MQGKHLIDREAVLVLPGEKIYDCIIIGAGPGGLQAAIYLGRYNRKVLIIDRGGGRTSHARHIENLLTQKVISGSEIIRLGMEQAESFNVEIQKGLVTRVLKPGLFEVYAGEVKYLSRFVLVSSGGTENLPRIENLFKFFGTGIFTCIDCDGYRTTGKKLVVIGNSIKTVQVAFGMKDMYTADITLVLYTDKIPEAYKDELAEEGIPFVIGRPVKFIGGERLEALEMQDGKRIPCEVVLSHFGYKLNDGFLSGLNLKRDADNFKFVTSRDYEASLSGLYIVGPLAGDDQVVIAAGEGAMAAIDMKKRLFEMRA